MDRTQKQTQYVSTSETVLNVQPHTDTHLHQGAGLFIEFVVVSELHSDGLVAVEAGQLHVCGVAHVEGAKEVCGPDA